MLKSFDVQITRNAWRRWCRRKGVDGGFFSCMQCYKTLLIWLIFNILVLSYSNFTTAFYV